MSEPLYVDLSEKESVVKDFTPVPRGAYHVVCTDGELRESKSDKNKGKPYYALEFTIQDGPHENRKVWTNAMCFAGALFTMVQLVEAMGGEVPKGGGKFRIPAIDELIGKHFIARVSIKPETDEYDAKNEIRGFKAYDGKAPASKKENDLLPS
jgi:hypothetical protein